MKLKKLTKLVASLTCGVIMFTMNVLPASAICCRKDHFDKSKYQGKLTGDMAKDVATIAKSQNGRTTSQFGYTEGWCDEFVADCIELAGGDSKVVAHGGTVKDFYNKMTDRGAVTVSSPKAGDLVFYRRSSDGGWPHVAIMTGSTDSAQGNISGKVYCMNYKSYGDGNGHSVGKGLYVMFVRPAYKNTSATVTFYRNLNSSDTKKVNESFTSGVSNQKFGYYTNGKGRYDTMNPANVGFGKWTNPGYDLLGWSKNRKATTASWKTYSKVANSWIIENSPKVTLYAIWSPHVYTVSFSSDGQLLSNTIKVTYGKKYGTLPVPEKEDAEFEGWCTADGILITNDSVYTSTVDQTLYAKWNAIEKKVLGDANSDGEADLKDLALLKRYLNNWNVVIDLSVCDFNEDGLVNMKDYALFQRELNK